MPDDRPPLFQCPTCRARWRDFGESWSLLPGDEAGVCCDNSAEGMDAVAANPVPWPADSTVGRDSAPLRYSAKGRETIDRIRDVLGDEGFAAFCVGNALKYEDRAGLKGAASNDLAKATWYREMAAHVRAGQPDPRHGRPAFEPYERDPRHPDPGLRSVDIAAVGARARAWQDEQFAPTAVRCALQLCEEAGEVARAVGKESDGIRASTRGNLPEEIGDVLLSALALADREGVDPAAALRARLARMESLDFRDDPEHGGG